MDEQQLNEEAIRKIFREELDDVITNFTEDFYASVGRSIVRRALVVIGVLLVYAAFKFGVVDIHGIKVGG